MNYISLTILMESWIFPKMHLCWHGLHKPVHTCIVIYDNVWITGPSWVLLLLILWQNISDYFHTFTYEGNFPFHIVALLLLPTVSEHFFHFWCSWYCYLSSNLVSLVTFLNVIKARGWVVIGGFRRKRSLSTTFLSKPGENNAALL